MKQLYENGELVGEFSSFNIDHDNLLLGGYKSYHQIRTIRMIEKPLTATQKHLYAELLKLYPKNIKDGSSPSLASTIISVLNDTDPSDDDTVVVLSKFINFIYDMNHHLC